MRPIVLLASAALLVLALPPAHAQSRNARVPARATPAQPQAQALSWAALGRVRMQGSRPQFDAAVQRLHGRQVTLQGFMLPLEQTPRQTMFLLTAVPMQDCFYCVPSGPESFVEIRLAQPVPFSYNRITVTGRFETLASDPIGLYRITGARVSGG
ncbi:MAG: DUF3299 domain-containing protein [Rubricoccaceae bacterium]